MRNLISKREKKAPIAARQIYLRLNPIELFVFNWAGGVPLIKEGQGPVLYWHCISAQPHEGRTGAKNDEGMENDRAALAAHRRNIGRGRDGGGHRLGERGRGVVRLLQRHSVG